MLPLHGVGVEGIVRGVFSSEGTDLRQRGRRLTHVNLAGDGLVDEGLLLLLQQRHQLLLARM